MSETALVVIFHRFMEARLCSRLSWRMSSSAKRRRCGHDEKRSSSEQCRNEHLQVMQNVGVRSVQQLGKVIGPDQLGEILEDG